MFKDRYSVKTHLRKLFMQKYERYLPTAFDESHSILEKVNGIIESHNRVIDMVNNHVEFTSDQLERAFGIIDDNLARELKKFRDELVKQTEMYEDIRDKIHSDLLPDSVRRIMEEWELDGTIEEMLGEEVLKEITMRLEDAENRIESNELMAEVSVKDFSHLVTVDSDGNEDWTQALLEAKKITKNIIIPEGEYFLDKMVFDNNDSDLSITGRGESTVIRTKGADVFALEGSVGEVKRVSKEYKRGSKDIYLDDTSGLEPGDDILLQSQKNCLNYRDTGSDWLLGSGTGDNPQRVPFAEFGVVEHVYNDRISLASVPIYPFYHSHSGDENRPVFDFARVRKVDFIKNVTIKDLTVKQMRSGFVFRTDYAKDCNFDGIKYIDNAETSGARGVCHVIRSYGCDVRNSTYEAPLDLSFDSSNYWNQNPFKITSCQASGFTNCKGINAGQMVDLSFFSEALPNTGCYIKDCKSINASTTGVTTHGGNYLTTITGNYIEGPNQGINHRGRAGIISHNTLIGSSYGQDVTLRSGVLLYQGGACDNIVSNNQIRNFGNGISYADGGDSATGGRARNLNTLISNNYISNCRRSIFLYRFHTGNVIDEEMNVIISGNVIKMHNNSDNSALRGIDINERNQGIIIRDNVFKGNRGQMVSGTGDRTNNFRAIYIQPNCDKIQVYDNVFQDVDQAMRHEGTYGAHTSGVYPNGVEFFERDNTLTRVRLNNHYGTGVVDMSTLSMECRATITGSITTSETPLRWYDIKGQNLVDGGGLKLSKGIWSLSYNFDLFGFSGSDSGAVTVRFRLNGERLYDYEAYDGRPKSMSMNITARNGDELSVSVLKADTINAVAYDNGTGKNHFSLVKISD